MRILDEAAHVVPALGKSTADATAKKGTLRVASSSTSTAHAIPSGLPGNWVDALAVGTSVQYAITLDGDTAPTLVFNQLAAFGTGHAAAGKTLLDSVEKSFRMPDNAKTLTIITASATSGYLEMVVSGRTG